MTNVAGFPLLSIILFLPVVGAAVLVALGLAAFLLVTDRYPPFSLR